MNDQEIKLCFAFVLLEKLKENHLTQKQFAELTGLSEKSIGLYIYGGRLPRYEQILLFADVLNCTPNDLMIRDEEILRKSLQKKECRKSSKY